MAYVDIRTLGDLVDSHVDADPSVGGGLVADIGSTARFDNGGVGEIYLKTGAAATAWSLIATGAAGETNTASNAGTGGVGVFNGKVGSDLEMRNIISDSGKVTVALDAVNKEVDLDVAEANLDLAAMTNGLLGVANGGTGLNAAAITAGQLLIGNDTNNNYDLATLTAGNGIAVTNADGSITLAQDGMAIATLATTDATVTTAATVAMATADTIYYLEASVLAIVTGGVGGFLQESCVFRRLYALKNDGGVLTQVGPTESAFTAKDTNLGGYAVSLNIAGTNAEIQVAGGAADNVNWEVTTELKSHA